ncbi:Lrp/AsnC family transcriptional regulator [Conexibacter arvalis]|uniref:Lrp/AsnC family leucine-responsive transcriptional regulator n=1 Tax=Conexibacter arvalis TaxID=912552 RepID=A0A840IIW7_9ACTN|nr:Lrp/AsnC family transcriptional regulator [Conexibacter arvalis]MBB4664285.1 Lrp/AsnC family leucine-responsive transcriptional regulator [Conexibacter arvalis]
MDELDWLIVEALQRDGRMSMRALARQVGLSASATIDRVGRLRDRGVITGFGARVDHAALGRPIVAFIRLQTRARGFGQAALDHPEIVECHRLTGGDAFIVKVRVASIEALEALIDELMRYGEPTTSIVLSTAFEERPAARPDR